MQTDPRQSRLPKSKKKSTGRPDPAPRPMEGVEPVALLDPESKDPNMEYRWASTAYHWEPCSVEDYQLKGWAVSTYQDGGVRPLIQAYGQAPKAGTAIERPGLVLMQKPKAAAQADWLAGQAETDRTSNFIKNGGEFGKRRARGLSVDAEVGDLEPELED